MVRRTREHYSLFILHLYLPLWQKLLQRLGMIVGRDWQTCPKRADTCTAIQSLVPNSNRMTSLSNQQVLLTVALIWSSIPRSRSWRCELLASVNALCVGGCGAELFVMMQMALLGWIHPASACVDSEIFRGQVELWTCSRPIANMPLVLRGLTSHQNQIQHTQHTIPKNV